MQFTDDQLLAYLEGGLTTEDATAISAWLDSSEAARLRLDELKSLLEMMAHSSTHEPSQELDWRFRAMLAQEMANAPRKHNFWLQVAAALALLVVGAAIGRSFAPIYVPMDEIAQLKNQVEELQRSVIDRTLTGASASERLRVLQTSTVQSDKLDDNLVKILLHSLNADDSPNVRYAALDALAKYIGHEHVRHALVKSLELQTEPIIQIALINVLANAGEKTAIAPLRSLINDDQTRPEVKKQATIAYNILL